jgi:putative transposase
LVNEKARVSYSENGAKGNTVVESFFVRMKAENGSLLHEARNPWGLWRVVNERMGYYNRERSHSTLGYRTLAEYIEDEGFCRAPSLP